MGSVLERGFDLATSRIVDHPTHNSRRHARAWRGYLRLNFYREGCKSWMPGTGVFLCSSPSPNFGSIFTHEISGAP
jgi:hypothetical protein